MSPEAQRIAIAEACGFTNPAKWPRWAILDSLPDYLNDLNAMHEVEKVLADQSRALYIVILLPLTGTEKMDLWFCAQATAAKRAEAFLRTIGKWEDDK